MQNLFCTGAPRQRPVGANSAHRSRSGCLGSTWRVQNCSTTGQYSPSTSTVPVGQLGVTSSGGVEESFAPALDGRSVPSLGLACSGELPKETTAAPATRKVQKTRFMLGKPPDR